MRKVQSATGDFETRGNIQWDNYCHGQVSQSSNRITRYSGQQSETERSWTVSDAGEASVEQRGEDIVVILFFFWLSGNLK
jgi:hypothetical protein